MAERGSSGGLNWFKAMCNPAGPRSCCYSNNTCVSLPVEECRCNGCQDLRQQIHAELSTWVPHDPQCKVRLECKGGCVRGNEEEEGKGREKRGGGVNRQVSFFIVMWISLKPLAF